MDFLFTPVAPHILRGKAELFFELYRLRQELAAQRVELVTASDNLELVKSDLELGIAQRERAEEALGASEQRYGNLCESMTEVNRMQRQAEEVNVRLQAEISERRQSKAELQIQRQIFEATINEIPTGVALYRGGRRGLARQCGEAADGP